MNINLYLIPYLHLKNFCSLLCSHIDFFLILLRLYNLRILLLQSQYMKLCQNYIAFGSILAKTFGTNILVANQAM